MGGGIGRLKGKFTLEAPIEPRAASLLAAYAGASV